MATVVIPTALRQYAGQQDEVTIPGATVDAVLTALTGLYPDLHKQLYSDSGRLRNFVNIYLNDDDVRYLEGGTTPAQDKDTISIIPAIAGGRTGAVAPPPVAHNGHDETLSHEE